MYNVFTHMPYSRNKSVCLKRVYHPQDNSECGRRFIADHYHLLGGRGALGISGEQNFFLTLVYIQVTNVSCCCFL